MKLEQKNQIDFASNAVFEGIDAKIDQANMHKLWDMLQNPYKNPIGAVVREYVSNSFDSHAEAKFIKEHTLEEIKEEYTIYKTIDDSEIITLKKHLEIFNDDAVTVSIAKDETGWYWATEDFGVGLSPSRVRDVFVSYLKSTKETSNSMIGAFGLGSKSGLAYADIVFIRTRYNGFEYQYMLRKGENGPRLDIIEENIPTTERNGSEIKIYFIEQSDINLFRRECKTQLSYFDNVYFSSECQIKNDFEIIKGNTWIATTGEVPHHGMHLCLGKVSYPIDYRALEIPFMDYPFALFFDIGELDIIQTREDVKYTPKTKKAILEKLELLEEEMVERWGEVPKECASLEDYYEKKDEEPQLSFLGGKIGFSVKEFVGKDSGYFFKPFKDLAFKLPKHYEDCFFEYKIPGYFRSRFQANELSGRYIVGNRRNILRGGSVTSELVRITQDHDSRKSKFILDELTSAESLLFVRVRKHKNSKLLRVSLRVYHDVLGLKHVPKEQWRTTIATFQKEIQKIVISRTISYDKTVITPEWIKAQKSKNSRDYSFMKITHHYHPESLGTEYWGRDDKKVTPAQLELNGRSLFLVGTVEDRNKLKAIEYCFSMLTNIRVKQRSKLLLHYEVAPTNIKKFKNVKNVLTVEQFKQGDTRVFRKMMSLLRLQKQNPKSFQVLHRVKWAVDSEIIKSLSAKFHAEVKEFETILVSFESIRQFDEKQGNNFISSDCYKVAETFDLFDPVFEKKFNKVVKLLNKLPDSDLFTGERKKIPEVVEMVKQNLYFRNKVAGSAEYFPLDINFVINMNAKYHKPEKKVVAPKLIGAKELLAELPVIN
jgi:hypothetical protein